MWLLPEIKVDHMMLTMLPVIIKASYLHEARRLLSCSLSGDWE